MITPTRKNRAFDEIRPVSIMPHYISHAAGSVLIEMGLTRVICSASIEDKIPPFLRGKGEGWLTAEYSMLPAATHSRNNREVVSGKQSGRTLEIQRLIGRSLRSVTDLTCLGERTITIDCDVIQADGGTRCAAITGGYVALVLACQNLTKAGKFSHSPINRAVAAVSVGLDLSGVMRLDLDYGEDSQCAADVNIVMAGPSHLVEVQGTAEKGFFSPQQLSEMMTLAEKGIQNLFEKQQEVLHHV